MPHYDLVTGSLLALMAAGLAVLCSSQFALVFI